MHVPGWSAFDLAEVIANLWADVELTMSGCRNVDEITADPLVRADA